VDYRDYDTRLAAYAVVVDDSDRILLALWNEGGEPLWTMPGGGVDFGETVEDGAVRELREETGYAVELVRVLGIDVHVAAPGSGLDGSTRPLQSVRVVFEARVIGGELTHEVDGSTDEARWIPLSAVPGLPRVALVDAAIRLWEAAQPEGQPEERSEARR